jgi:hypothetical protein
MGVIDLKKFLVLFYFAYLFIIFVGWIVSATLLHLSKSCPFISVDRCLDSKSKDHSLLAY